MTPLGMKKKNEIRKECLKLQKCSDKWRKIEQILNKSNSQIDRNAISFIKLEHLSPKERSKIQYTQK